MPKYDINYQTKTVYLYDESARAYIYYAKFHQLTKKELKLIEAEA